MNLTVLGSSSSGNAYVIQSQTEAIVIEAGIGLTEVKNVLGFNIQKVSACLISHSHGDHSGKARFYDEVFPVYTSQDVIEKKGLRHASAISAGHKFMAGRFTILPFESYHDVPCLGFFISHPDTGNIVFITDSYVCPLIFKDVNHILVEANYSDGALAEAIASGETNAFMKDRLMTSHMEIETTKKFIRMQNLDHVYTIMLLHLSSHNSDEERFIDIISRASGKPAIVAKKGVEVELKNQPF